MAGEESRARMREKADRAGFLQMHERLLARDPIAPAELAERVLGPMARALGRAVGKPADSEDVLDAVTDTLMSYIKRPEQFDPTKRGLWGYLLMSARGDHLNLKAKQRRRRQKERDAENVEELAGGRNRRLEAMGKDCRRLPLDVQVKAEQSQQLLEERFADSVDRGVLQLILQGERSTEKFAGLLGIESKSVAEQRRIVKRHKDRIKKRLERMGEHIRESERQSDST